MASIRELQKLWKEVLANGKVKNYSSKSLWVLETDTGKAVAHLLQPKHQSPSTVDADALRRIDSIPIENHTSWWKIYSYTTATTQDGRQNETILSVIAKRKVTDQYFGGSNSITYNQSKNWGVPLRDITDVKRDKKRQIIQYYITGLGWQSKKNKTLLLTCKGQISNGQPVFPSNGTPYIRTRRNLSWQDNLSNKG